MTDDPRDEGLFGLYIATGVVVLGGILVWLAAAVLRVLA